MEDSRIIISLLIYLEKDKETETQPETDKRTGKQKEVQIQTNK